MDDVQTAPVTTYEELAAKVEYRVWASNDNDLNAAIARAKAAAIGTIAVDPTDIDLAKQLLAGSSIRIAAACGGRFGAQTTSVKVYEARDAIRRGARQINISINTAKLESRHFQFVEMELIQLAQACHESGALLKVIFETDMLGEEQKLVACKIAKRSEVDIVQAGEMHANNEDEALLRRKCQPLVKVHSPLRGDLLAAALDAIAAGSDGVSTMDVSLLDEWKKRLAPPVVT